MQQMNMTLTDEIRSAKPEPCPDELARTMVMLSQDVNEQDASN